MIADQNQYYKSNYKSTVQNALAKSLSVNKVLNKEVTITSLSVASDRRGRRLAHTLAKMKIASSNIKSRRLSASRNIDVQFVVELLDASEASNVQAFRQATSDAAAIRKKIKTAADD